MSTILIIGGAGFIGRKTALALERKGHTVVICDNFSIEPAEQLPKDSKIQTFQADATNRKQMQLLLSLHTGRLGRQEIDVVYYMAAWQGYGREYQKFAHTNVSGAYAFWECFARQDRSHIKRVILASSQAVYRPGTLNAAEHTDMPAPESVYGLTKWQQEQAFLMLGRQHNIPTIALRYSIVLGPGQSHQPNADNGILRTFYQRWMENKYPIVDGDGKQVRDFVHIDDVVRANLLALKMDSEYNAFNVSGIPIPIKAFADRFQRSTLCKEPQISGMDARPGGNFSLTSGCEKLARYGWGPEKSIKTMIEDYVEWRKNL